MRQISILALILFATHGLSFAQAQRAVVQGTVTRDGTTSPVAFAQLVLNIAPPQKLVDAVTAAMAAQGAPAAVVQSQATQLMTIPFETLQANIDQGKARNMPPQNLAMLTEAQASRASRPEFPIRIAADAAGRFSIPNVPPGDYSLTVQRDGFFGKPAAEKAPMTDNVIVPVSVPAQGAVPELAVSLIAGAVIHGTVRGTDGSVLPNVSVQALPGTRTGANPGLQASSVKTNELGEYRLYWLRPGDYFVGVNPPVRPFTLDISGSSVPEPYVRTYFPDATDLVSAQALSVRSGDEVRDINITLRTGNAAVQPGAGPGAPGNTQTYTISGQVVNTVRMRADAAGVIQPTTASLVLAPRGGPGSGAIRSVGAVALPPQTIAFDIPGIAPGSYDLYARLADSVASAGRGPGRGLYVWGRAAIEITDRDVRDVTVTIHDPVDVNGKLTIDGAAPDAETAKAIQVAFAITGSAAGFPNYMGANFGPQNPKADGLFTVPNAAEGTYLVRVNGLNPNSYIADVRMVGSSVYDSGFKVGDRTPDLVEVQVATNGGIVEGVLVNADKAPEPYTRVVLVPPAEHRQNDALFKSATTDGQGRFTFRGIRPDDYKIFAWEGMPSIFGVTPALLARSEEQGLAVKVAASATVRVQVPIIPKATP